MSKIKNIGDTLPKNTPTTTSKPDFAKDVDYVNFTLPVKTSCQKITIKLCSVVNHNDVQRSVYEFDYLPNVDVNQYLQYVVNLYNNGSSSYPPLPL